VTDIIIKNKTNNIFLLIDVAIPSDGKVMQQEAEKKFKYKNLSIEIKRMWNMERFVIPSIIGATEIVTKGLKKSVNNTRKSFNRLSTGNRCTRDIVYNKESATVWNLRSEWCGVQHCLNGRSIRGKETCDKM
jgi:hypothetical protein